VFLIVEGVFRGRLVVSTRWERAIVNLFLGLGTFAMVCFAWVFFRAPTFERSFTIASAMLGRVYWVAERGVTEFDILLVSATMIPLLTAHWLMRDTTLEAVADRCPWWLRSVLLAAMLLAIATKPGEGSAFIYFQF
jgi:alginate O-acetyltransferase complex protein AlgI